MKAATKDKRHKLLGALFASAAKSGIPQEELRDVIAPGIIKKRLSDASIVEIGKVIDHIAGKTRDKDYGLRGKKKYESSLSGLKLEICDIARARWGETWESSLNAFCRKFGVMKWQWLNVNHAVAIKRRLREMQGSGEAGK